MKKLFSKRILTSLLCVCIIATSLPLAAVTRAAGKTFTEDFTNLDKWETVVGNYRISHSPAVKTAAAATTYGSKTVMTPVIANQNRAAFITTLKEAYTESDRRIETLSTTFNYVKGNGNDAGAGIYAARFNNYKGLSLQFGISGGYLCWQWIHTYYSQGAMQSGTVVDCASNIGYTGVSSTRKTSTKLAADSWITATLTYDYSKASDNELTVNATLTDGVNTETTKFVMSFDATGTNAYSESFGFGFCSTSDGNTECYIDSLTVEYGESPADVASKFKTDNADALSLTTVKTKADAEKVLSVAAKYDALSADVKAELTTEKAKLDTLKAKYKVTDDDFEYEGIFGEAWESLPENSDIQTKNSITTTPTTQTKAAEIVADSKNAGNNILFPENRSVSRKRRILTVKEEYLFDANINSFSTDVRIDSAAGWDDTTGIYFYYKDAYNWGRLEFSHTEGAADTAVRAMMSSGTADDITSSVALSNIALTGFGTGEWFNVKVDYEYTSTGTDLTFTFTGDTNTITKSYTTTVFNSGAKVGYGAGSNASRNVYYDNFEVSFNLTAAQFRTYFSDVLSLTTATVKEEDTEAVLKALKAYDNLNVTVQTALSNEYALLSSLEEKLQVSVFKAKYSDVLGLTVSTVTADDMAAVLEALSEYDTFSDSAKESLTDEYALLQSLEAVVVPADFKSEHASVLSLTASTVSVSDKSAVLEALSDYNSLSANAKSMLVNEYTLLQTLEAEVLSDEFEADYAGLLTLTTIANDSDLELLLSAVDDYAAFLDNVKASISAEYTEKMDALKTDYFGTTGITELDFSNTTLFNKVWQILGDDPSIFTPNIETTSAAQTQAQKIETVGGRVTYLPEYRAANRQRSIAVVKSAFNKPDATLSTYSVDAYFSASSSFDNNSCVYFFYKDINNWGRLQWTVSGDILTMRTQVNNGNGTASMTINNWKVSGISLNEWFTVQISYKYYSTYTDVTFKIISNGNILGEKTASYTNINDSSDFYTGIGAGCATAANISAGNANNKVNYSNIKIEWTLRDDELDMGEVKAFLSEYSDVLAFTPSAAISNANLKRLQKAIDSFFSLRKTSIEYLNENYGVADKLSALCMAIPDEAVTLFKQTHAAILAKTTDSVTTEDKEAIYAALMEYNSFNAVQKMALYEEGMLLSAMAEKLSARADDEDFSPFYDDFEEGLDKWVIDYTSSEDYVADVVAEEDNSTNNILKVQGNVIYITPSNTYWPMMGKMTTVKLRIKYGGYTAFNPPRLLYSYKDKDNYYGGSLATDSSRYYTTQNFSGIANAGYVNIQDTVLNMSDWIDVEISLTGKTAVLIFTDKGGKTFSVNQAYFESGRIAIGFNDNNGLTNRHPSQYMYVDDVYAEFIKGDWDIDEETTEIITYNTGNVWYSEDDIVTVSGAKLGFTVKSAKLLKLDDMSDVVTDYGYLEEGSFENSGEDYIIPAKEVNIDFSTATPIKFTHIADDSFQFLIPKNFGTGIYAMELTPAYEGEETKVILINRPVISAVIGNDGPSATQGGTVRIIGTNLVPTGDADDLTVILKNTKTNDEYFFTNTASDKPLSVYENDNYNITLSVPENMPLGDYAVLVHNGYGTNYAYSAPDEITIAEDIRASWPQKVFNVLDFGAIGDGEENDTGAVMSALQAAADNGGGVVYFPSSGKNKNGNDTLGMYMVLDTLFIPENVVLKGDGSEISMIVWSAVRWKYNELPDTLLALTKNVEVKDISLRGTRAYNYIKTYKTSSLNYDYSENSNIYVTDVKAYFYRRAGAPTSGGHSGHPNAEMTTAEIEIMLMLEMKDSYSLSITGSNVQIDGYDLSTDKQLNVSACRAAYMYTEYLQVRNSHFMKGTFHGTSSYAAIIEDSKYGPDGPSFMGFSHAYVARNYYYEQTQNNHELLLNDGKPNWSGVVQYVDDYTYRVIGSTFKNDVHNKSMLTVVQGQGVGQIRIITDVYSKGGYTYLKINNPFAVAPNRNSTVFIDEPRAKRYIINCTFEDGGCFGTYGSDIGAVYDGNIAQGTFNNVAFDAYYGVMWYVSMINTKITASGFSHGEGGSNSDGNVSGRTSSAFYELYPRGDYISPARSFLFRNNDNPNGAFFSLQGISTRMFVDIVFEENNIDSAVYGIQTSNNNDYKFFDGLTLYNNDFDGCTYDYKSGVLNDLTNELNENSMGDYNAMVLGENGEKVGYLKGDANLDGKVSIKDVTYIRYHLLTMLELTGQKFTNADYDEDGTVTLRDALLIRDAIIN